MGEDKNITVQEISAEKKFTWEKFKAGAKEWLRKQIVNLKRRPSNIAFLFLIVSSLIYVLSLGTISQSVYSRLGLDWTGISTFVCTLFSVLSLVMYMNAFPKRKKVKVVSLVLCVLFMALMVFMDIMFYVEFSDAIEGATNIESYWQPTLTTILVHIIFIAITAILMATMPLYTKALMKINTKKDVDSTEIKGELDLEDSE